MIKRRIILSALGKTAAGVSILPGAAFAQGKVDVRRIGFVFGSSRRFADELVEVIMNGVRASAPARVAVEAVVRSTEGDPSRFAALTAEVLAKNVSVILGDGPAHLRVARAVTTTVPIVAIDFEDDPVAAGYAQGIARPGGNVTGIFLDLPDFAGKWIEFLRECMPGLSRLALIWDVSTGPTQLAALNSAAEAFHIQTELLEVRVRDDYAGAFALAKSHGVDAVILPSTPLIPSITKQLAELSLSLKLPTITMFSDFVRGGGLLSYGPNLLVAMKQVGTLMDRVLSGTAPGDLPIERPTKFELLVNARTAQSLGLTVPLSISGRADEVME